MALWALILAVLVAVASFAVFFTGLISAAGWAGVPTVLRPAVPLVVDSSILVFTVAAVVARGRGADPRLSWAAVGFSTLVSMVTNATHALSDGTSTATTWPAIVVGAAIAGLMPVACLVSTHTAVSVAVAPPHGSVATRRRAERQRLASVDSTGIEAHAQPDRTQRSSRPRSSKVHIDASAVVSLVAEGKTQRQIADELGTSKSTVQRVLAGGAIS